MPSDRRTFLRHSVASAARLPATLAPDDAISAVMCTLTERITAGEAHELIEALPRTVRSFFEICVIHREGRSTVKLDRAEFIDRVAEHLGVTPVHAELVCAVVFDAIRSELPNQLAENVARQLPHGLSELWLAEPPVDPPVETSLSGDEVRRALETQIADEVELPSGVSSADAFAAVMCAFSLRLSGGEAKDLLLSLPDSLRRLVDRCMVHRPEPATLFGRDDLVRQVGHHLGLDRASAGALVRVTMNGMKRLLPKKVASDVAGQLPRDLLELWESSG